MLTALCYFQRDHVKNKKSVKLYSDLVIQDRAICVPIPLSYDFESLFPFRYGCWDNLEPGFLPCLARHGKKPGSLPHIVSLLPLTPLTFEISREQLSYDHLKFQTTFLSHTDLLFQTSCPSNIYFLAVGPSTLH